MLLMAAVGALLAALVAATGSRMPITAGRAVASPAEPDDVSAVPVVAGAETRPGCDARQAALSPRDRVAQLVVVGVNGDNPAQAMTAAKDWHIGGIFVQGDRPGLLATDGLSPVLAASAIPLLVSVDDEGGRVQTVAGKDGDLPSARTMAETLSPQQVRERGAQRGRALIAAGVTVDFAPVVDLTDQDAHSVIGDRSFSADPATAKRYAAAFAKGLGSAGVLPVLKHFPGHGHGSGDSHKGAVTTPPLARLRTTDLVPYQGLADYGPAAVMVGHLDVPDLTDGVPASIAAPAYRLLRQEYRFTGLAFTDDLSGMRAVTNDYPLPEAVLKAITAGADQALSSSPAQTVQVLDRLERALADGELPDDRVRESVNRVLAFKGLC